MIAYYNEHLFFKKLNFSQEQNINLKLRKIWSDYLELVWKWVKNLQTSWSFWSSTSFFVPTEADPERKIESRFGFRSESKCASEQMWPWVFGPSLFSGFPKRKALKQALSYDGKRKEKKKVLWQTRKVTHRRKWGKGKGDRNKENKPI